MGRAGRARAEQHFAVEPMVARYEALLMELTSCGRRVRCNPI
jgi:hypothetical protein